MENIRKVVSHNGGRIILENPYEADVKVRVEKSGDAEDA
jgi:hypothetical protein